MNATVHRSVLRAVKLLVVPPLEERSAAERVDAVHRRLGALIGRIAEGLTTGWTPEDADAWIQESHEIDDDVDRAWSLVHVADESRTWNPRRRRHPRRPPVAFPEVL